jgi:hypothetical protein
LHKIYLEQCDYFHCLFSGNWVDSGENRYDLSIVDDRITFEGKYQCFCKLNPDFLGLNTVFASLYQNEIDFELKDLGGILSASALFNLVSLHGYVLHIKVKRRAWATRWYMKTVVAFDFDAKKNAKKRNFRIERKNSGNCK